MALIVLDLDGERLGGSLVLIDDDAEMVGAHRLLVREDEGDAMKDEFSTSRCYAWHCSVIANVALDKNVSFFFILIWVFILE